MTSAEQLQAVIDRVRVAPKGKDLVWSAFLADAEGDGFAVQTSGGFHHLIHVLRDHWQAPAADKGFLGALRHFESTHNREQILAALNQARTRAAKERGA